MIAFVTTIGEPTTDMCIWSLKRNGFEVHTVSGEDSLADKLVRIVTEAYSLDVEFLRVDADVIVNKYMTPDLLNHLSNNQTIWWWQFKVFDWFQQHETHSMSFIKREALLSLRKRVEDFKDHIRPETGLSRIEELHNPRRMITYEEHIMGIHGYGIRDMKYVIKLKANRGQSSRYDFELARKLYEL